MILNTSQIVRFVMASKRYFPRWYLDANSEPLYSLLKRNSGTMIGKIGNGGAFEDHTTEFQHIYIGAGGDVKPISFDVHNNERSADFNSLASNSTFAIKFIPDLYHYIKSYSVVYITSGLDGSQQQMYAEDDIGRQDSFTKLDCTLTQFGEKQDFIDYLHNFLQPPPQDLVSEPSIEIESEFARDLVVSFFKTGLGQVKAYQKKENGDIIDGALALENGDLWLEFIPDEGYKFKEFSLLLNDKVLGDSFAGQKNILGSSDKANCGDIMKHWNNITINATFNERSVVHTIVNSNPSDKCQTVKFGYMVANNVFEEHIINPERMSTINPGFWDDLYVQITPVPGYRVKKAISVIADKQNFTPTLSGSAGGAWLYNLSNVAFAHSNIEIDIEFEKIRALTVATDCSGDGGKIRIFAYSEVPPGDASHFVGFERINRDYDPGEYLYIIFESDGTTQLTNWDLKYDGVSQKQNIMTGPIVNGVPSHEPSVDRMDFPHEVDVDKYSEVYGLDQNTGAGRYWRCTRIAARNDKVYVSATFRSRAEMAFESHGAFLKFAAWVARAIPSTTNPSGWEFDTVHPGIVSEPHVWHSNNNTYPGVLFSDNYSEGVNLAGWNYSNYQNQNAVMSQIVPFIINRAGWYLEVRCRNYDDRYPVNLMIVVDINDKFNDNLMSMTTKSKGSPAYDWTHDYYYPSVLGPPCINNVAGSKVSFRMIDLNNPNKSDAAIVAKLKQLQHESSPVDKQKKNKLIGIMNADANIPGAKLPNDIPNVARRTF